MTGGASRQPPRSSVRVVSSFGSEFLRSCLMWFRAGTGDHYALTTERGSPRAPQPAKFSWEAKFLLRDRCFAGKQKQSRSATMERQLAVHVKPLSKRGRKSPIVPPPPRVSLLFLLALGGYSLQRPPRRHIAPFREPSESCATLPADSAVLGATRLFFGGLNPSFSPCAIRE